MPAMRQHGGGGDGDAVQAGQRVGAIDRGADGQHRPGGGLHRHAQAGDDVGAVAGVRGCGDVLHRRVFGAGVVLGDPRSSRRSAPGRRRRRRTVASACIGAASRRRSCQRGDEVERDQREHAGDDQARYSAFMILPPSRGLDEEAADDGGDDRHAAQHQRVEHRVRRRGRA